MNSDNPNDSSRRTSRGNGSIKSKEIRFPKFWLSTNKQTNLMSRSNENLYLLKKRSNSNWSCGTTASAASRTSEITFGCDKEIEVNNSSLRSRLRSTYIDDNFAEFSVHQNENKSYRKYYNHIKMQLVNRGTQTDYGVWYLFSNRICCTIIIFLVIAIILGLTYFSFRREPVNFHSNKEQRRVSESGTALDNTAITRQNSRSGNSKQSDEFAKLCQNINDVVEQLQSKLTRVEKEVALFQHNDANQKQMDELVYGHLYGSAADYALEATGGSVIDTPDTTTYTPTAVTVSLFGLPLWNHVASHPRIIIKGAMQPGQCWSFHGSEGRVIIRLAYPIKVSSIALEHFPAHLLPSTNDILSAPRQFTVTGFIDCEDCSNEEKLIHLGSFDYKKSGPSRQMFYVQRELFMRMYPVQLVEFHFQTNYGNADYTCVYRVRVHGKIVTDQ